MRIGWLGYKVGYDGVDGSLHHGTGAYYAKAGVNEGFPRHR